MNAAAEKRTGQSLSKAPGVGLPAPVVFVAGLVAWLLGFALLPWLNAKLGLDPGLPMVLLIAVLAWSGGSRLGMLQALLGCVATFWFLSGQTGVSLTAASQVFILGAGLLTGWAVGHLKEVQQQTQLQQLQLQDLQSALSQEEERRERQGRVDALTGIHNRQHFNEVFYVEHLRAARYGEPLSVLLLDVDHLRRINDEHSHGAGDQVLQDIAHILQSSIREMDLLARYGGEEFVLVLPCTPPDAALLLGNRLRAQVSGHIWAHIDPGMVVTLSGGLCSDLSLGSPEAMLRRAEELLDQAKQQGRNHIQV